jgi:hypothetical protein
MKMKINYFSGFKTFAVGLAFAVLPQIVTYVSGFDFTHTFGLSPNASSVVGIVIVALRAMTTTPMFKKG